MAGRFIFHGAQGIEQIARVKRKCHGVARIGHGDLIFCLANIGIGRRDNHIAAIDLDLDRAAPLLAHDRNTAQRFHKRILPKCRYFCISRGKNLFVIRIRSFNEA